MSIPELTGVIETALYVDDIEVSLSFYKRIFEFETFFRSERGAGLNVSGKQGLLLFLKGGTPEAIESERGIIPAHDGDGNLHMAFAIPENTRSEWEVRLSSLDVPVVGRYEWERGGHSIYFRDPDDHLIELVTPGCWPIY